MTLRDKLLNKIIERDKVSVIARHEACKRFKISIEIVLEKTLECQDIDTQNSTNIINYFGSYPLLIIEQTTLSRALQNVTVFRTCVGSIYIVD